LLSASNTSGKRKPVKYGFIFYATANCREQTPLSAKPCKCRNSG
jgi:hypothetical protein